VSQQQDTRIRPTGLWSDALREEWFLAVSLATAFGFSLGGESLYSALSNPLWLALIFLWLFGTVIGSALAVVRHADAIAEVLGEPYGTLVLTLAVTAIEVMSITAVMLHGANNPTLVRDTLFAVIMIVLGMMVGGSLLLGGWRHREQQYNLQSERLSRRHHSVVGADPQPARLHRDDPRADAVVGAAALHRRHIDGALCRVPRDSDRPSSRLFPLR
jgi:hypothetical protein